MAQGSIVKRKSGKYSVFYRIGGKQYSRCIGYSKKEAEVALRDVMQSIDQGTENPRQTRTISFTAFCDQWLKEKEIRRKASTYKFYRDICKHQKDYFKDRPLHHITIDDIEAYVQYKVKEGKLAARSINYHITVLRMIFKRGIEKKRLKDNPAQAVGKLDCEHKEMDYLKPDEVRLFLENVDKRYYPLFLTAVMTGLRQGEILGLKWEDIEWPREEKGKHIPGQIFVRRALCMGKIDKPKSKHSKRPVTMAPELAKVLKTYKMACPISSLDLIFPNSTGKIMDARDLVNHYFLPALRRAGLRRIRFHDLRHTFASLAISNGANLKAVQASLGHGSIQVTMDRYSHLLPEARNGVGECMQNVIFGSKKESSRKAESL